MANVFDSNPIVIDTVSGNVDIGNSAFGISEAPFFVRAVRWQNPTMGDVVKFKNYRGEEVLTMNAVENGKDVLHNTCFDCQGLKLLAADQTMTTGAVLIYV